MDEGVKSAKVNPGRLGSRVTALRCSFVSGGWSSWGVEEA